MQVSILSQLHFLSHKTATLSNVTVSEYHATTWHRAEASLRSKCKSAACTWACASYFTLDTLLCWTCQLRICSAGSLSSSQWLWGLFALEYVPYLSLHFVFWTQHSLLLNLWIHKMWCQCHQNIHDMKSETLPAKLLTRRVLANVLSQAHMIIQTVDHTENLTHKCWDCKRRDGYWDGMLGAIW